MFEQSEVFAKRFYFGIWNLGIIFPLVDYHQMHHIILL